jgi:hypothetical protein
MQTTTRRNLLKGVMAGGVIAGTAPAIAKQKSHAQTHMAGPHAHATVVFGQWQQAMGTAPLDRHPSDFAPSPPVVGHHVSPLETTIAVNGSVAFLIGGFHQLGIYDDGIERSDINAALVIPPPAGTMFPPLVNDPHGRIYRGPDPRNMVAAPVDRVEVFHFHRPGTYMAICLVLPHFNDGMFGFIRVVGK